MNEPLTQNSINNIVDIRRTILDNLKPELSRKLFYALEEKVAEEQKRLQEILDWQEGRNTELSKYTLILDTHYFEQEFLN